MGRAGGRASHQAGGSGSGGWRLQSWNSQSWKPEEGESLSGLVGVFSAWRLGAGQRVSQHRPRGPRTTGAAAGALVEAAAAAVSCVL